MIVEVGGRAHQTGEARFRFDEDDPLREGFNLDIKFFADRGPPGRFMIHERAWRPAVRQDDSGIVTAPECLIQIIEQVGRLLDTDRQP